MKHEVALPSLKIKAASLPPQKSAPLLVQAKKRANSCHHCNLRALLLRVWVQVIHFKMIIDTSILSVALEIEKLSKYFLLSLPSCSVLRIKRKWEFHSWSSSQWENRNKNKLFCQFRTWILNQIYFEMLGKDNSYPPPASPINLHFLFVTLAQW